MFAAPWRHTNWTYCCHSQQGAHTEWISKGKAGVPQQLGIRVCIVRDQFGFILQHKVMENTTDDKVAVSIIFDAKQKFQNIKSCSFDIRCHRGR